MHDLYDQEAEYSDEQNAKRVENEPIATTPAVVLDEDFEQLVQMWRERAAFIADLSDPIEPEWV